MKWEVKMVNYQMWQLFFLRLVRRTTSLSNLKPDKIKELMQSESSLTNIEVVERCFGPQQKSHVVGFGGGITAKELKGGNSSKAALLEKLNATVKENESLKGRLEGLESKYDELGSKF